MTALLWFLLVIHLIGLIRQARTPIGYVKEPETHTGILIGCLVQCVMLAWVGFLLAKVYNLI